MGLIEIKKNPSKRDLLWFGLLLPVFGAVFGAVIWRRTGSWVAGEAVWAVLAAATVVFAVVPPARKPIYLGFIYATFPIGWVVGHVLMAIIFYGAFMPMGLIMRALGRDPLHQRLDRTATTYWIAHRGESPPERYFRQF